MRPASWLSARMVSTRTCADRNPVLDANRVMESKEIWREGIEMEPLKDSQRHGIVSGMESYILMLCEHWLLGGVW